MIIITVITTIIITINTITINTVILVIIISSTDIILILITIPIIMIAMIKDYCRHGSNCESKQKILQFIFQQNKRKHLFCF